MKVATLPAKLAAECVGTAILCFTVRNGILAGNPLAAMAIGSSLMVAIYSLGSVSGAHLNPAVTLGVFSAGKMGGPGGRMPAADAGLYVLSQLLGSLISCTFAGWLWTTQLGGETIEESSNNKVAGQLMAARTEGKLGSPGGFADYAIFEAEALYTMMLVFVVLNVATCDDIKGGNNYFGLAIGWVIIAAASAMGIISGTCLNPAVTFGIAITDIDRNISKLPLYWGAQIVGAGLATLMFYGCRVHLFDRKKEPLLLSKLLSEFLGTFMLVATVCLVVRQSSEAPVVSIIGIASSLMCMIYALWNVSGANFNPAVSFGLLLTGNLPLRDFALYCLVQILGGFVAVLVAASMWPTWTVSLTNDGQHKDATAVAHGSVGAVVGSETLYTFLLVFGVLNTAVRDGGNHYFGLVIGFCVVIGGVAVGGLSGGCFNPAVSLSLVFSGLVFQGIWGRGLGFIYFGAELLGGALAAAVFYAVSMTQDEFETVDKGEKPITEESESEDENSLCA